MATALKNLSGYNPDQLPEAGDFKIAIILSEWNKDITGALYQGAYDTLIKSGVDKKNILLYNVPGTFELTYGAKMVAEKGFADAIIVLGCVIQGETRHFDFICQGVSFGISQLNILYQTPVIFGVLTTDNLEQAFDRAGGKHGNKGVEAAYTALKMIELQKSITSNKK
ncbi:MAG: 6,7-dimethyl-8-ribityllumazine synthase [Bacteroidales bacterium]